MTFFFLFYFFYYHHMGIIQMLNHYYYSIFVINPSPHISEHNSASNIFTASDHTLYNMQICSYFHLRILISHALHLSSIMQFIFQLQYFLLNCLFSTHFLVFLPLGVMDPSGQVWKNKNYSK